MGTLARVAPLCVRQARTPLRAVSGYVDMYVPASCVLFVQATRTRLLRAVRTGYAYRPSACCTCGLRVPAFCVLYRRLRAACSWLVGLLYARHARSTPRRAVRPASRATPGVGPPAARRDMRDVRDVLLRPAWGVAHAFSSCYNGALSANKN